MDSRKVQANVKQYVTNSHTHSLAELWGSPKGRLCPFPFTMHVIGSGQLNMKQLHCDNAHTWRQVMELLQQKAGSKGQSSCYLFINEEVKVVSTHTTSKTCCGGVRGHWCKSHCQCFWKRSNTTGRQVWRCLDCVLDEFWGRETWTAAIKTTATDN